MWKKKATQTGRKPGSVPEFDDSDNGHSSGIPVARYL